jgi:Zn-dependent protease with chaperone function
MTSWLDTMADPGWRNLVFALLHTLWQGAVLSGILYLLLKWTPVRRHNARYLAAFGTQLGIVLAGLVTWAVLDVTASRGPSSADAAKASLSQGPEGVAGDAHGLALLGGADPLPAFQQETPAALEGTAGERPRPVSRWIPLAAVAWLIGVGAMFVRMALSVTGARRLARGCELTEGPILDAVERMRATLRIGRRVRVVVTKLATGPAVQGIFLPTLLLPASMATGLAPDALRAVLAHELAHIRRNDYLFSLVQMAVEAVLFFNPAVWWISRQIRREREACCDFLAVSVLGEPVGYARALADCAQETRPALEPAMALLSKVDPGSGGLLDRVRRILVPGYQPELRLSWMTMAGLLVFGLMVLGGLRQGTSTAVAWAAEVLSPAERIEQLQQAQREYGPSNTTSAEKFSLSGTIVTNDGRPVSGKIPACLITQTAGVSITKALIPLGHSFSVEARPGINWLYLKPEKFAPAVAGPFQAEPGESIRDVEIVLDPGFPAAVRIVDEQGRPVPGATVTGNPAVNGTAPLGGGWSTDEDGSARIEHASSRPYRLTVRAPGFQKKEMENVQLSADQTPTFTVQRARPTIGQIVSVGGEPIGGATLRQFATLTERVSHIYSRSGRLLATSDEEGNFVLDSLEEGLSYALLVETEKHGRRLIEGVKAGQEGLRLTVGPNRSISGTIVGHLEKLERVRGRPVVRYSQRIRVGGVGEDDISHETGDGGWAEVEIAEGKGRFTVSGLLPGEVNLRAGPHALRLDADHPPEDLVIDLSKPPSQHPTRHVVLRLVTPDGNVLPQGELEIIGYPKGESQPSIHKYLKLVHGRASLDVHAPGRLVYRPKTIIGYWFEDKADEIGPGHGPLEIPIPVVPAGAIAGEVLEPDGTPALERISVGCKVVQRPPGLETASLAWNNFRVDSKGKFFISPVPLGGTYVVTACRMHNKQVSRPVRIDGANPTGHATIRMASPLAAEGLVLGPDGQPLAGIPVTLALRHPLAPHSWSPPERTDRDGRFRFNDVNAEVGEYWADLRMRRDFLPTEARLRTDGEPVAIRLETGRVVEGRVVDAATGWPIPGVEFYAQPAARQPGEPFVYEAEGKTDGEGRFRFSNLPDRPCRINDRSGLRWQTPQPAGLVHPGRSDAILIRATLPEWSKLKPVPQ